MHRHSFPTASGIALLLLAGCGGGSSAVPQSVSSVPHSQVKHVKASKGDLLYVTDGGAGLTGRILVYTFPEGTHVSTLEGYAGIQGACSDSQGDVFVVAPAFDYYDGSTIVELSHGGSQPIATLTESGQGYGCASDPTTGALAVANYFDHADPYNQESGDVAVFENATGNAKMYYPSSPTAFLNCGYDNDGNLYLSDEFPSGSREAFGLVVLLARSSSLQTIKLSKTLFGDNSFFPSVQWDGSEMTISSLSAHNGLSGPVKIYQLSLSGTNASVIGTTTLKAKGDQPFGQTWIQGSTIVGFNQYHGPNILFWPYKKGGKATHEIQPPKLKTGGHPTSVTVSVPPSK
jgi:hypothetical protein